MIGIKHELFYQSRMGMNVLHIQILRLLEVAKSLYMYTTCITGHQCTYPGCKRVLVLDGNMKNRRDVCMARDAGYTKYEGLPGALQNLVPVTAYCMKSWHVTHLLEKIKTRMLQSV